jgi:hypothetical protein
MLMCVQSCRRLGRGWGKLRIFKLNMIWWSSRSKLMRPRLPTRISLLLSTRIKWSSFKLPTLKSSPASCTSRSKRTTSCEKSNNGGWDSSKLKRSPPESAHNRSTRWAKSSITKFNSSKSITSTRKKSTKPRSDCSKSTSHKRVPLKLCWRKRVRRALLRKITRLKGSRKISASWGRSIWSMPSTRTRSWSMWRTGLRRCSTMKLISSNLYKTTTQKGSRCKFKASEGCSNSKTAK